VWEFPDLIDLRFRNKVQDHTDHGDHISLDIDTDDGTYSLKAQYALACDGAGSPTRKRMELPFDGKSFEEHFLIVDVEMTESPFDTDIPERWFWFEPKFHAGQSALLHRQPDNIYRIDLQLGPDTDPVEEALEENVLPRIKAVVGDKPFRLDWMSVYKFRCAMLEQFVHGRMIFAGDSAHVVSPFGARGGNGGIQDVDNLCWKLAAVLQGDAPESLLASYDEERRHGAEENILNSSRATNFMTPKSEIEHLYRDQVLALAHRHAFARRLINSGRLSVPCSLEGMALQSAGQAPVAPGHALVDAPLEDGWLVERAQGQFMLMRVGKGATPPSDLPVLSLPENDVTVARYGRNLLYLLRPDGHVAAVFDATASPEDITAAGNRAVGKPLMQEAAE